MSILPPRQRGPLGRRFTAGAARGRLELPVCGDCGRIQYPPREVCGHCLSEALAWRPVAGAGTLLAVTRLHHSNEPYFAARLPLRLGTVSLGEGAQALAYLAGRAAPGETMDVRAVLDRGGEGVLVAQATGNDEAEEVRSAMQAFTFDPAGRRIALYAATPSLARAVSRALRDAGAAAVVRLDADPGAAGPEPGEVHATVADPYDPVAVRAAAGAVDALVVSGLGAGGAAGLSALPGEAGREAMARAVAVPLALADALREPLAAAGGAVVQLVSVFARAHLPAMGLESALQATALSATEGLRARGHAAGVRVLTVFAGPFGGPDGLALPAAPPGRLAHGVVAALASGVEESAADPVAEDILAKWRDEPKALERELAAMGEADQ